MDLIQWDQDFFLYLNNLGSPSWDFFWLLVTDKKTWIPLYILLIYYLHHIFGFKKALYFLLFAGIMIVFTDQISLLFKDILIKRLRPCHDPNIVSRMRLVKEYCGGTYGFFSAHASNHMAIAVYLGLILNHKKWILSVLILWAFMIAYSRIYIGVHYPLDILSGMLIGSLLAIFFFQVQKSIIKIKNFK